MAINVNTVYQTVLSILNKEQRGYLTPAEFNKVGAQVQLEVFEKYFEDLNQQLRVPQADADYSDRIMNLDEKLAIFKTFGDATYNTISTPGLAYFTLPTTDAYGADVDFYRLGTVTHIDDRGNQIELQRLSRTDFYNIERSPLTKATKSFPTYLYENRGNINVPNTPINNHIQNILYVNPTSITSNIKVDYIRKPVPPIWGFSTGTVGQYIFDDNFFDITTGLGSRDFELHESEQTNVILRILAYSGIIIEDPNIIQVASQQVQGKEANKKS
tara:strand:+ start:104 stop:919 length:816 start_codon:yes stop_codon:yes gene_type:complete